MYKQKKRRCYTIQIDKQRLFPKFDYIKYLRERFPSKCYQKLFDILAQNSKQIF